MAEEKRFCDDFGEENPNSKRAKLCEEAENSEKEKSGLGTIVAAHYNTLEEKGTTERNKSRIIYLRNFNNWIKSQLISDYLQKCRMNSKNPNNIKVLDMGCGKGGDLLKWRIANIKHLICTDLAEVSLKQCEIRYEDMKKRKANGNYPPIFTTEFFVADCTKTRIRDLFKDQNLLLDLVSCQFSFHYCFESLPQAECMMRNASENLRPGGYFIGTIPNANDIVARQRKANGSSFGNNIFEIKFNCDVNKQFPLFGAQYEFFLEGVVNCPEFLVHFPTLIRLAAKYGLKLVEKETFRDYFEIMKETGRNLLSRMQALETYPPNYETVGRREDYVHAETFLKENPRVKYMGTLSQAEWEACTLYMVFAFVKEDS